MLIIKTKITALGIVQRKDNMAILSKATTKKMTIDLTGPNGNAFYLLGTAANLMKQMGYKSEQAEGILAEMRSSDYENLIKTFDEHFGSLVDLER